MEIRKASQDDIGDLFKLKLKLKNQDAHIDPYLRPVDEVKNIYKQYIIRDLKNQDLDRVIFVAVENRSVIAYIRGTLTKTLHVLNVRLRGIIDNLYVEENYRRKGIAKKLVKELINWFKEKNVDVMTLHVYPSNSEALALYKKFGFKNYSLNMSRKL